MEVTADVNCNNSKINDDVKSEDFKKMKTMEKIRFIISFITVEPFICCIVVGKMISGPAMANLHMEKACKVNAKFNDSVCDSIVSGTYLEKNFTKENNAVQSYLIDIQSWEVPISSIIPVILVLFLGSFSDRHKIRKPFLLIPIIGDVIAVAGSMISVLFMNEWSLEVQVILDRVIPSLFGAEKLLIVISYAYIADISTPRMRVIRLTTIPIMLNICIPIVHAISGILFHLIGYIPMFFISFCLFVIALLNGIFMLKESVNPKPKEDNLIKDVFNIHHVIETFRLLLKNENNLRNKFLTILLLTFIHTTVSSGEQSTFFLFAQAAYQWTVVDFSYFITARTVVNLLGLSIAVPMFSKVCNFSDVTIVIISYLDTILISIIYTVYKSPIGVYIGIALSVLRAPGHAANRSLLTKAVVEDDMAKAFSLSTIIHAIAAAVSAQIYSKGIYAHTRETFPQAFFLFGIAMHSLGIPMLIWLYFRDKKDDLELNKVSNEENKSNGKEQIQTIDEFISKSEIDKDTHV